MKRLRTIKSIYKAERQALNNAIHRCTNPKAAQYADYGGRGISVDPSFTGPNGFANFLKAVGPKPSPELTLDRIDNSKNYEAGNLAWSSRSVQQRNRRKMRAKVGDLGWGLGVYWIDRADGVRQSRKSPYVPAHGKMQTLKDWALELGIHQRTLKQRLMRGVSPEEALVAVLFNPWGNPRGQGPAGMRAAGKTPPTIH